MPKIFFPVIWFKQTALIDDIIGPQLKLLLLVPEIGSAGAYIILSIGVTIVVIVAVVYASLRRPEEDEALLVSPSSTDA